MDIFQRCIFIIFILTTGCICICCTVHPPLKCLASVEITDIPDAGWMDCANCPPNSWELLSVVKNAAVSHWGWWLLPFSQCMPKQWQMTKNHGNPARTLSFNIWHPCMWWYSHIWRAVSAGFVELRGRGPWCIICDLINTEILDSSGNSCKEILVPFFPIWCRYSSSLRYMYAVAWGQGLYPL